MALPPQFLDEIRARVGLVETVARKVRLTRHGPEHKGLCPFHNEKTPSFTVSEDKGFFHCFGCGAHGDVIGFVMRSDGLGFREAVERLAGEAGLTMPGESPEDRARVRRQASLHGVVEAACAWFEAQLRGSAGAPARDYLSRRGVDGDDIARFRIGFAPDSRQALRSRLIGDGFPEASLVEAGLLRRPDDGRESYDWFRGRVMFPITDRRGRVIAFGGRALGEGEPKYLNSPETPLFRKGEALYGLAQALGPARARGEVIVAEGYLDVIACHRAGFGHAVAPLGTALTEAQLGLLWRLAPEPGLCLDGDAAGARAAARVAARALPLLAPGRSLRFAFLPAGEDPDSLIAAGRAALLADALDRAQPLVAFLWDIEAARVNADTPERRAGLKARLDALCRQIVDPELRREYQKAFRARYDTVFATTRPGRPAWRSARPWATPSLDAALRRKPLGRSAEGDARRREQVLVATVISHPRLLAEIEEEFAGLEIARRDLDRLRNDIITIWSQRPDIDSATLRDRLADQGHAGTIGQFFASGDWHHPRVVEEAFARPEAELSVALAGWREVAAQHRSNALAAERDAGVAALADDLTEEGYARFIAGLAIWQRQGGVG